MKTNKTDIKARTKARPRPSPQAKDGSCMDVIPYMGFIQVHEDHPGFGIRKGTIKCVTADDLMATFEAMLDAGLVHGRDFDMYFHRHVMDIIEAYGHIMDILDTYQRRVHGYIT